MIDATIRAEDVLTADPRELTPIIRTLPAFTIADALHMARITGRTRRASVRMLRAELRRRHDATMASRPVVIEVPPYDLATSQQLLGGLAVAGWSVKALAARLQVSPGTIYRVARKEETSRRMQVAIMDAISGKLKCKED